VRILAWDEEDRPSCGRFSLAVLYSTAIVHPAPQLHDSAEAQQWCCPPRLPQFGEAAMNTFVSALVALSVLASIAGPAVAVDAKTFYEHQDRAHF